MGRGFPDAGTARPTAPEGRRGAAPAVTRSANKSCSNSIGQSPTAAAAVKSTELEVDDINEDTLEDDESLPEDTSDLVGGDDDDVNDVIENVETGRDES